MRVRRVVVGAVVAAALGAAPGLAGAVPTLAGEFEVDGTPGHLTVGLGGNAWVVVPGVAHDTARAAPDGTVTHFDIPSIPNATGAAGMTTAPNGRIWATVAGGIVSFDPADPLGSATLLAIAQLNTADDLSFGPGGRLYAVGLDAGAQARIFIVDTTTAPGVLLNAGGTVLTGVQTPRGVTAGGDGLMYIGDFIGEQIAAFDPATSAVVATYPAGGGVQAVGAGPVTQIGYSVPNQTLGRLNPGGNVLPTTVPGSDSFGIALGNDGAYWAPGFVSASAVRLTTDGAASAPVTFTDAGSGPRRVAAGPDNTVWFSLEYPGETKGKVARVMGVDPPPAAPGQPGAPGVPAGPGAGSAIAPDIGVLRASRRVVAGRPAVLRVPLSQAATLRVRVVRLAAGRRVGNRCVAPRPAVRRARTCVRTQRVGAFAVARRAGQARVAVGPRIGRTRMTAGRYRIDVSARNGVGLVSPWRSAVVRVVPR